MGPVRVNVEEQIRVSETVGSLLEAIDEHTAEGEEVSIGQVIVIVEVNRLAPGDDEPNNGFEVQSSDDRRWTVYGLLALAADAQKSFMRSEED